MLFNEPEVLSALERAEAALAERTTVIAAHERTRTGRTRIAKEFPRQQIVHDLSEEEKVCPHDGTRLERFGEEVSERYGYQKARIWVEQHVRPEVQLPVLPGGGTDRSGAGKSVAEGQCGRLAPGPSGGQQVRRWDPDLPHLWSTGAAGADVKPEHRRYLGQCCRRRGCRQLPRATVERGVAGRPVRADG
ncbi:MAG: IS66 family transposase zinc-finger binding domain-containing protein [Steroidobacteraceae bacterium]